MAARWSIGEARAWWDRQSWPCGINYLPSSAVNFLEMWQAESFDPVTIDRELAWAADIGFNAIRVNLPFVVWEHDRDGLLDRLDRVLDTGARHGLRCVPCPFDDCEFGGAAPALGRQPDPVPGVHNSRAVASPGRAIVMDRASWPRLERYLRDLVGSFATDARVLFWDLYNEPGNRMIFGADGYARFDAALEAHSHALMRAAFGWAREMAPEQPLTVGAWYTPPPGSDGPAHATAIDRDAVALSDIVSFHAYGRTADVAHYIEDLARHGRPMVCTEWMARAVGSRIADQLALYRDRKVGCFQWGLVRGRTQTHLPWPGELVRLHGGRTDATEWFHDLLEADGRPRDPEEIETIRRLTGGRDHARAAPGRT